MKTTEQMKVIYSKAEDELLKFVNHAITKKKRKRGDDYEHIGCCIEAKIKLVFKELKQSE